uniref:Uncharacterized protein n=1 Tax=Udotea flabellum TaxID=170437 RepID=A0A386B1V5_9CHLO|nr:hypothetical protein [Udotea flabellum]AYC65689.1 hypothetical protein [Udotea flabellum]
MNKIIMKQKTLIFIFLEGMCFSQDGSLIGIKKNSKKILRRNSADGVGLAWGLIGEILDQLEFLIKEKRFLYGNTKIRNHIVSCLKKFTLLLYLSLPSAGR